MQRAAQHQQAHSLSLYTTVCGHLGLKTGDLAGSELVHAGIVGVVHEVVCM
jgi:hypothetical protein